MSKLVFNDVTMAHRYEALPCWEYHTEPKGRENHGIVFVQNGSAVYSFSNAECVEVRNGSCLYLPRECRYAVKSGLDGFDHITVNFSVEDDHPLSAHWFALQIGMKTEVRQLFEKLIHEWYKRRPYYREKCLGYLYAIIAFLLAEKQELTWEQLQKIEPARVYLEEHFKENVSLHDLAGLCGISQTYFRRLFQTFFHETPLEYQRRLRLSLACELLREEDFSISETAALCGYRDIAYFSRVFLHNIGLRPSAYRNSEMSSKAF